MCSKCLSDGVLVLFLILTFKSDKTYGGLLGKQEPGWNPGIEAQAVDRLYRLGQVHEVHVYRYYVEGSLEMNIHQVQRRKGELAV